MNTQTLPFARKLLLLQLVFVIAFGWTSFQWMSTRACSSPSLEHIPFAPATVMRELIDEFNGLPRQSIKGMDLSLMEDSAELITSPIAGYEIIDTYTRNGPGWFFDDDPTYSVAFTARITFQDGATGTLSWDSWNYGKVVCPFVVSMGDGPPGYISMTLNDTLSASR